MSGIKDRLIQFILRGKDELSPEARKAAEALEAVRAEGEKLTTTLDNAKGAQGLAENFKTTSAAADRAKAQWEAAERRAQDLRDALDRAPDTKGLAKGLKDAERAADAARGELETSEQTVAALRKELEQDPSNVAVADGLAEAEKAADAARDKLEASEQQVESLRDELESAPGTKGLEQSLRAADREAAKAAKTFDQLTGETQAAEQAAEAAGIDTRNLAGEQDRLAREVEEARQAVEKNNRELRDLEKQQRQAAAATKDHGEQAKEKSSTLVTLAKRVAAVAAAYVSYKAVLGLVQKGVGLVSGGIREMLTAGSDSEQAVAQLNAALESTGHAAGLSTEQLQEMAKELRDNSMFDTEQILSAQTRLLSYTDVVGEQFPKAMQIIIDQSQRTGQSIEQSAETVGRALQTPSKAMEALGRQGFKLEEGQKKLLQQLEATGRTAEAQAIIMDMLSESYGGSAAAARFGTLKGLIKGLREQFSDFFEMIADAGAFEYVKEQLTGFAERIRAMAEDGSLKRLAESLSNAFIQGAEKVKEFGARLMEVDIGGFADQASTFFNNFGAHIDDAMTRIQLFIAPFRTLFNGVTSGVALMGAAFTNTVGLMLTVVESVAARIPDILGGPKIRASVQSARETINALRDGFVEQIEQDGQDIRDAWDVTARHGVKAQQVVVDAATAAEQRKRDAAEATAAKVEELNERFKKSALDAVLAGTRAIADMADALELIDTAKSVQQLEQLKQAMLGAYRTGSLSQEEYNNGLNLTNEKIRQLAPAADSAASSLDEMVKSLKDFSDLAQAIKGAQTDVDINKLTAATKKLYSEGSLTADEYRKSLAALEKQKADINKANEAQSKSEKGLSGSIDDVTRALREQAAASAEAANALQQEGKKAEKGLSAWGGYIGRVLTAARTPLAQLSSKALATFDSLMGLNNVDIKPDLSGVQGVQDALKRLREDMFYTNRELQDRFRKSFARWASQTVAGSQRIQKATLEQRLELERLMESYERGGGSIRQWLVHANSAKETLTLLDGADLDRLNAAIDAAKQRMTSFGDSARSTLDSLRDELDQLQGNEEAIERRRMARRRRELQMQIAEARAAGDTGAVGDLQQALGLLATLEAEQRLAREQAERDNRRAAQAAQVPGAQQASTTAPAAPATVIRLETDRGRAVDVSVPVGQEDALLAVLEQAGLRSL